jgi:hypothetical protein
MMPSCSKISGVAMIVPDVNVLVHAMDSGSAQHDKAWAWWYSALHGDEHIGFAWPVLIGVRPDRRAPANHGRPRIRCRCPP